MPAAFYRHFDSMEALGLVLIDESFRALRDMLRGARAGKLDPSRVIESSVDILIAGVNERREHWRFIGRERNSGVTVLRYAIRTEIRLITSELAIDLARFPGLNDWSAEDLNILASLFVNSMISIAEAIEDAARPDRTRRDQAHRGQAAADDHRRDHRMAQQRTGAANSVSAMPHLELTRPRPDIAVITLNRPEKLNALNYGLVEDLHQHTRRHQGRRRLPRRRADRRGPRILLRAST